MLSNDKTSPPIADRGYLGPSTGTDPYQKGKVAGIFNQAARLKPGNLLVTYPPKHACYQVDPKTGEIGILFSLRQDNGPFFWRAVADRQGAIYCTLSGGRTAANPISQAIFGIGGFVVRVDHRSGRVDTLIEGKENGVVDPCGIALNGNELIIADFYLQGGPPGLVYSIDKDTGLRKLLIENLNDPCSAFVDASGTLWIANGLGDSDGDVLAVDPKGQVRAVLPRHGQGTGCVTGVCPSNDEKEVIVTKVDWPMMVTTQILRLNKKDGTTELIDSATKSEAKFFTSNGVVVGDIYWYGESIVYKKIFGYNLKTKKIVKEIDCSGIMGTIKGVQTSYDMLEAISVVPHDLVSQDA
ncbi:MAG TPA: hypothetical protein VJ723_01330 [Candidatus Angelobacter sp.]|nr:hypothetical protein [Candidatus Angelobacter sp.]